jgi:hypothetical protein
VATTAAAFDEGGNFIDVRFGPLTSGFCTTSATLTSGTCTAPWSPFAIYNPLPVATNAATGDFRLGQSLATASTTNYAAILLQRDRNGAARSAGNWIRGAYAQ